MTYDFSKLYKSETIDVLDHDGNVVFIVTVREISYGEKTDTQAIIMTEVDIPLDGSKKTRQKRIAENMKAAFKNGVSARMSIHEEVAAISVWRDTDGNDVPICAESLRAIPKYMAEQIVEVIERLNPDLDDEFQE
jgi:hypothetical protein